MWNEEVPEPLNYTPVLRTRYGADPVHVKEAAALLINAKRPVIYAGQGVHYAKAWPQLKRLAERLAIPGHHEPRRQIVVPRNPSGCRLVREASPCRAQCRNSSAEADVILRDRLFLHRDQFRHQAMPQGKTIIHSTLDPEPSEQGYRMPGSGWSATPGSGARRACSKEIE